MRRIAVVYTSVTGNTKELAEMIYDYFKRISREEVWLMPFDQFSSVQLEQFDVIAIGTYTWGNGVLPKEMVDIYRAFEEEGSKHIVTGVFGTGDRFYPNFCGAVDLFRDMLYVHTTLAVTLKVELTPQQQDIENCIKFVNKCLEKAH